MQSLQMKSKLFGDGKLEMYLDEVEVKSPSEHEVIVRMEASPINPSDLGVMFGVADLAKATTRGSGTDSVLEMSIPEKLVPRFGARIDKGLPVGNEGAGVVVEAGPSPAAQALMGKTVAVFGGACYTQYKRVPVMSCLPHHEGTTSVEAASSFVNPMTALSMTENMRMDGKSALVHTAAASNLGQMLNRICMADGIPLLNIVRKDEQAALLKSQGAKYVCDSSSPTFMDDLTDALAETGATLAFDATGGGELASNILTCMERAAARNATEYSVYGSTEHKQVYLYGGLDTSPTTLHRAYGMFWGVGGWLLPPFLQKIGPERVVALQKRVADEIKTTFASNYTDEISLVDALQADIARRYQEKRTGEKYLIRQQS